MIHSWHWVPESDMGFNIQMPKSNTLDSATMAQLYASA
jgi:hypothetical protein|tara:strand:+ start:11077 stop:11190 length:114 start_codon:yes stop_codon:yes gene_type:complete